MGVVGKIKKVAGPLVIATGMRDADMFVLVTRDLSVRL